MPSSLANRLLVMSLTRVLGANGLPACLFFLFIFLGPWAMWWSVDGKGVHIIRMSLESPLVGNICTLSMCKILGPFWVNARVAHCLKCLGFRGCIMCDPSRVRTSHSRSILSTRFVFHQICFLFDPRSILIIGCKFTIRRYVSSFLFLCFYVYHFGKVWKCYKREKKRW